MDTVPGPNTSPDTLSEDLANLNLCDAKLKVQEEEFPVHRMLLASRSPVFAAMFQADMPEKNTDTFNIEDCSPGAFRDFLAYVYSGKLQNLSCSLRELYAIADKYRVQTLMSDCVLYIMHNLSVENVCEAIALGHQFNEGDLKTVTQKFIIEHFHEIVLTDNWLTFMGENPYLATECTKTWYRVQKNIIGEIRISNFETFLP